MHSIAVCLLNLHEDERMKPKNWVPVGWLPVYDESRDTRPGKGFDSTSARKYRLYHACWIEFLDRWAERTKDPILTSWPTGRLAGLVCLLVASWEISRRVINTQGSRVCVIAVLHLAISTFLLLTLR